jgi:hypothetical protein
MHVIDQHEPAMKMLQPEVPVQLSGAQIASRDNDSSESFDGPVKEFGRQMIFERPVRNIGKENRPVPLRSETGSPIAFAHGICRRSIQSIGLRRQAGG